jgi:Na+/H+-dicarboxylate symporter
MKIKAYFFSILLLSSLILGGFFGYFFGPTSLKIKPVGDLFLNLIFTTIVPLLFFSVAHSITKLGTWERLGKLLLKILSVMFTGKAFGGVYAN